MKYFLRIILVVVFFISSATSIVAQEKNKTHKVVAGETVRAIAAKYHITPYDLIKVNPDLVDPPTVGTVLVIPVTENDVTGIMDKATKEVKSVDAKPAYHIVKPKETLFSLSKLYNVHIDDIFDANPHLVDGLKVGMKIHIPETRLAEIVSEQRDTTKFIRHIILPKETRWGICHKYSITEEQLIDNNPIVVHSMNIGDTLWIPKSLEVVEETKENISFNYTYYEVKPKDTMYGISKKFGISIDKLRSENPIITKDGLKIAMVLRIPKVPRQIYDTTAVEINTFTNLPNDSELSNAEKIDQLDEYNFPKVIDVVLMLPFYLNKNKELIHDITKGKTTTSEDVEKDEDDLFYSRSAIALEFYNGALFAIDSLKRMGLSVRLRVFDTQKDLNVVKNIMAQNDFSEVDVVIGPLYTENVEYVADELKYDNILVVSPLSKQLNIDNRFNLVQAMPTKYTTKNSVLREVVSEKTDSTNIVVFGGTKDSLSVGFVKARLASKLDSNLVVTTYIAKDNLVDRESVFKLLHPNKDNVVVIDSDSNILATDVITAMNQVADSLPNRAFLISNPKILKQVEGSYLNRVALSYPTDFFVLKNSDKVKKFNANFRKEYNYFPSMFSYRGFDITYEILLSLGRSSNSEIGILHDSRRGIQGKFEFVSKPFGGYFNRGVFMIQYKDWKLEDVTN